MAGDLKMTERAVLDRTELAAEPGAGRPGKMIHKYGKLSILAIPEDAVEQAERSLEMVASPRGLGELEQMGLAALQMRESSEFLTAKKNRPRADEAWNMTDCISAATAVDEAGAPSDDEALAPSGDAAEAPASGPTSAYLEGTVAVGIIIVQGPTADLKFSGAERTKVLAEVQNGLSFFATSNPVAGISFSYDIQVVTLTTPADPTAPDLEALWRNPAMQALGFSGNFNGVRDYVEDIRNRFGTQWTFCGFFTKYPLNHFAYASIGGPRLVMDYANDGWGPDNIDRVFAHETGHIFGAPDEYGGCVCGGSWGRFNIPNGNCVNCDPDTGVPCLMKGNTFALCGYTPSHLGWSPQLLVHTFGYSAGGWRVERHPRFMADTNGNGRADIVGFGNAGVYVSRSLSNGRFGTPALVVNTFGYNAGGWRVDRHPRFMADTTGDGRADIVGFGNAGVYLSRAQTDGSYAAPVRVVDNFGYNAGGWRVDRHPRFMADTTGDGRADIVGFGNAGVYVSRAQADGSYAAPVRVVDNFGYNAGGWRVDRHPRFMADTTGDGRADIVGFGNAGVYVSRAQADGSYTAPTLVVHTFGYNAGGWRVDRHPRFMADTTGDGRADIVGFGNAGVYVSKAQAEGSYAAPTLVVGSFGYNAGGWRVDRHPRILADTTGDGRLDVVGFGDAGVYVSRMMANDNFDQPGLVIRNFGYTAGGWRVSKHPRFLADTTGDGRADFVGFGNAGVYVSRS